MNQVNYSSLDWSGGSFNYPNMVKVSTIGDGSCLFHAVISAFFTPYRKGMLSGTTLDRRAFVLKFRHELADKLAEPIDPANPEFIWYNSIGRGELSEFAKSVPSFSLEAMQKELRSSTPVDNRYNEYLSNVLNKDIFLIDAIKKDVYITGDDHDILYMNRNSIVILYNNGHYELVGTKEPGVGVITLMFKHDDPFILTIRQRLVDIHKI